MTNRLLQWAWERLTAAMIRRGFGVLWMRHFIATEVDDICKDPIVAKRAGFAP